MSSSPVMRSFSVHRCKTIEKNYENRENFDINKCYPSFVSKMNQGQPANRVHCLIEACAMGHWSAGVLDFCPLRHGCLNRAQHFN